VPHLTETSALLSRRRLAPVLWTLSLLFLLRVLGQVLVVFVGVDWLPASAEWYSGLLAYPFLLPAQIVILAFMVRLNLQASRGTGYLAAPHPRLARALLAFAAVYAAVMVVRYVISGSLHPERRLLPPGTIPIVFHCVLASYVALLGVRAAGDERRAATS